MAEVELVIFDCDGVLVDSEAMSVAALLDMVKVAGGALDEDEAYEHFLGKSMASVREILASEFGLALTDEHISNMRADLLGRFRKGLKPIAGVKEMLPRLAARRCVASSGTLERIRFSLEVTGLIDLFDPHLFSAAMVPRGKPAPDLFLHASQEMGAMPRRCLVVEDSPAGIEAARAAGMRVLAFVGGSHARNPALTARLASMGAELIFADMLKLPELIAGLGSRAKAS